MSQSKINSEFKKDKFVEYILQGLSQRDAAIKAGYSEKRATVTGCKLAKDEYVYIEDVLPLNQVKVISHTFQNGQTVEISAIIPTYVLREADYVESSFTRYL